MTTKTWKYYVLCSFAALFMCSSCSSADDSLVVRIDSDPAILILPAASGPRSVSFSIVSGSGGSGQLSVCSYDPLGTKGQTTTIKKGTHDISVPADGPRQMLMTAETPTDIRLDVSVGSWALYFPSGRGEFSRLRGEQLIYFPRDNTPGVLPSVRIRLAGTSSSSSLSAMNIGWRIAPEILRIGPFEGRFDHSFTAECRGGESLLVAEGDCRDMLIHFPDRPFGILSSGPERLATIRAIETMPRVTSLPENLVPNGGFEDDIDGDGMPDGGWWRYWPMGSGAVVLTNEKAHGGQRSLKCSLPGTGEWVSKSIPISPGDRLRLSFWALTEGLESEAIATFGLRDKNLLGIRREGTEALARISADGQGWRQYQIDLKAADEAAYFYCSFHHDPGAEKGVLYVDDVKVRRLNRIGGSVSPRSPLPIVGRSQMLVRLTPSARMSGQVEIHVSTADRTRKSVVNISPGQGQLDVPVGAEYQEVGWSEAEVAVTDMAMDLFSRDQEVLTAFKVNLKVPPLFATRIVEPCYVCVEDKLDRVSTEVTLNASAELLSKLGIAARLIGADQRQLWSSPLVVPQQRDVSISVPIEGLPIGRYVVQLTLFGQDKQEQESRELDFHIVNRARAVVRIDENQKLVSAGKPFFPIGIWPFVGHWDEIADETGVNCLMNWGWAAFDEVDGSGTSLAWMKHVLDEADRYGLKWMVGTPGPEIFNSRFKSTLRRVRALRNHPGMLVWEEDETIANGGTGVYESVKSIYNILQKEDPNHPFVVADLVVEPGHAEAEVPTMGVGHYEGIVFPPQAHDIAMWWWYPFPLPADADGFGCSEGYDYVSKTVELAGDKPLWLTLQPFAWNKKRKGITEVVHPTIDQIKCQAYLAITWGVDGLYWYGTAGGGSHTDHEDIRANPPLWLEFKNFTKELRELEAVLCAADERDTYEAAPKDFVIDSVMKTHAGRKYLIAANRNKEPREATFSVPSLGDGTITVFKENRTIKANNGRFVDDFVGFGTHVYIWPE